MEAKSRLFSLKHELMPDYCQGNIKQQDYFGGSREGGTIPFGKHQRSKITVRDQRQKEKLSGKRKRIEDSC